MDRIITKSEDVFEIEKNLGKTLNGVITKKLNGKKELEAAFTFIDLFAGIGGIRIPFQQLKGKCVFTSEWDKNSQKTYYLNFKEVPNGDINAIDPNKIPYHDILLAGFPCQAFSVAGYRKGFEDTRGTLFFNIAKILDRKKPARAFLLENVKGLVNHDKGKTLKRMREILENLNYKVSIEVLNTMTHANIPQNRERVLIVGIHENEYQDEFMFPKKIELTKTIHDFVEKDKKHERYYYNKHRYFKELKDKVTSRDTIYQWRRHYVRENKNNACPTLTANMGTGGHNVPIILDDYGIRKLTPQECANFQGFPKDFLLPPLPETKLYYQIGNSVTVPLIERVAKKIISYLGISKT